jgi:hypothetical protein
MIYAGYWSKPDTKALSGSLRIGFKNQIKLKPVLLRYPA